MRVLFLDRDGVVNEQIINGYVITPQQFIFIDGVIEALQTLRKHFDKILLATNQQCVGKALCSMAHIDNVHAAMQQQLHTYGIAFDKIYCCPHLAADHCGCRKPDVGMAQQALLDFPTINFSDSIMVGDSLSDMQFAVNAGMLPVHVGAVRLPEFEDIRKITPHHYNNLLQFAQSFIDL